MTGILEQGVYLDPRYEHLNRYALIAYKSIWTPAKYEKLIQEVDAPYYHNKMSLVDKECVRRCLLSIAMVEDKVKNFWNTLNKSIPQTMVSDVGALFGFMETTHRRSYHSANSSFGVNTAEIEQHEVLKDRLKYLSKHLTGNNTKGSILKNLSLFTSLVERGSLFPSFYILMSFSKNNKGLQTIAALQESTALEELIHYQFGIELINIIKLEYPDLWEEYALEAINKSIKMAHDTELKLVDWFFEQGVPQHLSKDEIINFLNYNFNIICEDLNLPFSFPFDEKLYREKSDWMLLSLYNKEPDFFNMAVGGYSSTDEQIDLDNFKF